MDSDAGIACFDSKYHYLFWRPIMAIRNAQIDGNPATQPDPTWTPLLRPRRSRIPRRAHLHHRSRSRDVRHRSPNPPHRRHDPRLADGTPNNWTAVQTFRTTNDLDREVVNARVWAGLHYRGSLWKDSNSPAKSDAGPSDATSNPPADRRAIRHPALTTKRWVAPTTPRLRPSGRHLARHSHPPADGPLCFPRKEPTSQTRPEQTPHSPPPPRTPSGMRQPATSLTSPPQSRNQDGPRGVGQIFPSAGNPEVRGLGAQSRAPARYVRAAGSTPRVLCAGV